MSIARASLPLLAASVTSCFVLAPALAQPQPATPAAAPAAPATTPGSPHAGGAPGASPHAGGGGNPHAGPATPPLPAVLAPAEKHLRNLRQLTFGGENAEAYFSLDGTRLSMQSTTGSDRCDQIYTLDLTQVLRGGAQPAPPRAVTTGQGRHTCSYFFPDASRVLFSSTRHLGNDCPPTADRSKGYVWSLYNYQIYTSKPDGSDVRRVTNTTAYDAEATVCKDGSVVFTSDRDGDLELYRMNLDGSGLKRLTFAPGYDGGAFFSEDCKRLVWRAARPKSPAEQAEMQGLLKQHLVRPTRMELWTGDADGGNAHPVTDFGSASFAPFFYPASVAGAPGKRIIFSSNYGDPRGREFDIWAIDATGDKLERITHTPDFDGFPMFSPDGKHLVFSSNRGGKSRGETNVFLTDWVPGPIAVTPTPAEEAAGRLAFLTDPRREGRGVGTKGLAAAAEEIAKWMQALGLKPAGEPIAGKPSYFQPVEVFVGVRDTGSAFKLDAGAAPVKLPPLKPGDVVAAASSSPGKFGGELRFAGFGITAPEARWDDLATTDVKGHVAVVLRGVPEGKFNGAAARSYSDLRYKAWNLREHGAQAVVFVDLERDELPQLTLDGPEGGAGVPVAFLRRSILAGLAPAPAAAPDAAAKPGAGASAPQAGPYQHIRSAADGGHAEALRLPGTLSGEIKLQRESRKERNVLGVLPATEPAAGTSAGAIVLGAHYDHLGLGGRSSLAPGQKAVHPGADDNASGTVALLETAQRLGKGTEPRPVDIVFAAFTGEEVGLVGSSRFVQSLAKTDDPAPTAKSPGGLRAGSIKAMLNFDMVGRLASRPAPPPAAAPAPAPAAAPGAPAAAPAAHGSPAAHGAPAEPAASAPATFPVLAVQGTDSAAEWAGLVAPRCAERGLACTLGGDGYGPSDMTPFYAASVPVLFFFTGAHADYHRPSDTADKINVIGILQIADLAAALVRDLGGLFAKAPAGLTFKKPAGPAPRMGDRGYGAYLGTIPDYTAMQGATGGVKLSGARPGSPAEKAGVQAGDVLVGLGDSTIGTLEDMAFSLRKYKPGQTVDLTVLRGGQKTVLKTTLTQRPQQ